MRGRQCNGPRAKLQEESVLHFRRLNGLAATHGVPLAVNEFGLMRWEPGAAAFMADQMDLFEQRGMNHTLWEWASSFEPQADNDAFNFRHGPDPDHHTDLASSDRRLQCFNVVRI